MRYWFDTEFVEDGKTIELISIGIVAEDDREYYAINQGCDFSRASQWVKDNVIAQLPLRNVNLSDPSISPRIKSESLAWKSKSAIASEVLEFVGGGKKPEFWAYYADYDWVVFCQLFGTMMDLPGGFPMYCRDVKQECDRLGNPDLPEQCEGKHNALADARWNKMAWEFLRNYDDN